MVTPRAADLSDKIESLATLYRKRLEEKATTQKYDELFATYQNLVEDVASLSGTVKALSAVKEFYNKQALPAVFEQLGSDIFRAPSIKRSFYPITKFSATVKNKDAAFEFLREHGLSELIQTTVNASLLTSALVNLMSESAIEPPPQIIALNSYKITGSSKYTPKKQ